MGGGGSGEGEEATGMRSLGAGGRGRIGEGQELVRSREGGGEDIDKTTKPFLAFRPVSGKKEGSPNGSRLRVCWMIGIMYDS